jgi:hypothetical protein
MLLADQDCCHSASANLLWDQAPRLSFAFIHAAGSSFWVVVRAAETAVSQGAGSKTLQESEQVVGCVGLKATLRGDAKILHLAVVPRDQVCGVSLCPIPSDVESLKSALDDEG